MSSEQETITSEATQDHWAQWLLWRRFGGDAEQQRQALDLLYPVRDHVLDNARVEQGETLLDVGCGDGLIGFAALERVGEAGRVIFSDISTDLLRQCQLLAQQAGVEDRCEFVPASADDLSAIAAQSVDVVTTRSVLIYVADKQLAFAEFYRVLKPGGRISLFEPINRFGWPEPDHLLDGYDVTPVIEIASKVKAALRRTLPDGNPMLDFDERDLLHFAEQVGFAEIHLELLAEIAPVPHTRNWDTYLNTAFNPLQPTLKEAISEALTTDEAARLEVQMRPLVEARQGTFRLAKAYLWAVKR
jgi:ubiquinone/menaquinone biosynthesis C-methylase UbiE